MKEKIKTQLRIYLDIQLRLCKVYMQEQNLTMAKTVWQQAIGAVSFVSAAVFNTYYDNNFSTEIDAMWEKEYRGTFDKVLLSEVGE